MLRNYAHILKFDISDEEVADMMGAMRVELDHITNLLVNAGAFAEAKDANQRRFREIIGLRRVLAQVGVTRMIRSGVEDCTEHDKRPDQFFDGHNIHNFLQTYELLAKQGKLTLAVHDEFMRALPGTGRLLGTIKTLLDQLASKNKITQAVMNQLFADLTQTYYLSICLQELEIDRQGDWLLYVLENTKSADEITALVNFLQSEDCGELYEKSNQWLTFDVFKVIVANAENCQQVMPRLLGFCAKRGMFNASDVNQKFTQFITNALMLHRYEMPLNEDQLALTLAVPEYCRAIAVCRETGFIQAAPNADNLPEYEPLFKNMELVCALAVLKAILNKLNNHKSILKDINALFKLARLDSAELVEASSSRFFSDKRINGHGRISKKMKEILKSYHMSVDGALHWRLGFDY